MLNFEKVFSQIKKRVENDFLEVPFSIKTAQNLHRWCKKLDGAIIY